MGTEAAAAAGDVQPVRLVLEEALDVTTAGQLVVRCRELAAGPGAVEVEAGAVERVDTAGLQVLLALAGTLRSQGRELRWGAVSTALIEAARLAGAAGALGMNRSSHGAAGGDATGTPEEG